MVKWVIAFIGLGFVLFSLLISMANLFNEPVNTYQKCSICLDNSNGLLKDYPCDCKDITEWEKTKENQVFFWSFWVLGALLMFFGFQFGYDENKD